MKELIVTNLSTPSHFPKLHRSLSQADSGLVFITHCPTISTHEDWSETYVNRFELSYISTRWNQNVLALTSASSDPYEKCRVSSWGPVTLTSVPGSPVQTTWTCAFMYRDSVKMRKRWRWWVTTVLFRLFKLNIFPQMPPDDFFFSHVGRIYGAQLHECPNPMPETLQIQMVTMGLSRSDPSSASQWFVRFCP